jgi:uncharacterized membrane protein
MKYVLWIIQILLAALFLFAGVVKFITPAEQMQAGPISLPLSLIYFVGIAEILGALGLLLPGLLGVGRRLTSLAAMGLVVIMIGAIVITLRAGLTGIALFSLVVGLLAAFVAYGRRLPQQAHRA